MSVPGLTHTANGKKQALAASRKANAPAPLQSKVEEQHQQQQQQQQQQDQASGSHGGRPSRQDYDREQESIKAEIEKLQQKSNAVRAKIQASQGKGPSHDRKVELRKELEQIRQEQASIKGARGKTLDSLKQMQDNLSKKIKDLQANKQKANFKSVQEVDQKIKQVEQRVESGTMKLVDEKKALAEIQTLKKQRKVVESFDAQQKSIDDDKAKIDETRAALDSPEARALSEKFDKVKSELDKINKDNEEASKGRDSLFDERNSLSKEIDALYARKKESAAAFKAANDKYYQKMNEERQKRAERQKAERAAYEEQKRSEQNERLLEEARAPAFEREIEDCSTLIDFFKRRIGIATADTTSASQATKKKATSAAAGLPQLGEARQVDASAFEGAVLLTKKRDDEDDFFAGVGGSKKDRNKKQQHQSSANGAAASSSSSSTPAADEALNLPYGTLTALLTLGIASPLTTGDVPKTIDSLELKKKYFVDNQDRVTKDNVAKAEKRIADFNQKSSSSSAKTTTPASTNGEGEKKEVSEKKEVAEEKKEDAVADATEATTATTEGGQDKPTEA